MADIHSPNSEIKSIRDVLRLLEEGTVGFESLVFRTERLAGAFTFRSPIADSDLGSQGIAGKTGLMNSTPSLQDRFVSVLAKLNELYTRLDKANGILSEMVGEER